MEGNYDIQKAAYEHFKLKDPNAFFVRRYMQPGWDGFRRYITENGSFKSGLLEKIYPFLIERGDVVVEDYRDTKTWKKDLEEVIKNLNLREYQMEAVAAIYNNQVGDIQHPVGVVKAATNAGKTHIACGIYKAFRKKPTLFLVNRADLYNQIKKEIPEVMGIDEVGFCQGKNINLNHTIVIAMVQSLKSRAEDSVIKKFLASIEVLIVDECDLAESKTYKSVIQKCINAWVRVGMSGTMYEGKLAKHKFVHENLRQIFGEVRYEITNRELIDRGHSSEVIIRIRNGNTLIKIPNDYEGEYHRGITISKERNKQTWLEVKHALKRGRKPILIVCRYHLHIKKLHRYLAKKLGEENTIDWLHPGKGKLRKETLENFKQGKIDVLVSSLILKRGMNLPLTETVINAAGGDDPKDPLQILGRAMRKKEGKKVKYFVDFMDEGKYLKRHSKHRLGYYKAQNLKIKILGK